ncbi:MAG: triosephosphate isomerase [Candidatus Wildermuthbacteria bacterium]|nr:triosephosphate isomerase [Candidatus Wildermuthbacteria bacterium]
MKKTFAVGNWKMNPVALKDAEKLFLAMESKARGMTGVEIMVCPPFPFIAPLAKFAKKIVLAGQDCSWSAQGAFTGEVSPYMLKSAGARAVLLGHSERKKYCKETRELVAQKMSIALEAGLKVIVCAENPKELAVTLRRQKGEYAGRVIAAYEPSYAISTRGGRSVSPGKIARAVKDMRNIAGPGVPILYGGSVFAETAGEIMREGDADGFLVGAASLNAAEFLDIVAEAEMG